MHTLRLNPGESPVPQVPSGLGQTLPLSQSQKTFAERVEEALVPFLSSFVGPVAAAWVAAERNERGGPNDLVSALAFGYALVMRIPKGPQRDRAREGLEELLRSIKVSSVIPPPVRSAARE